MFNQVINQRNERRVTCLDWPLILLRRLLKYWSGSRCCSFGAGQGASAASISLPSRPSEQPRTLSGPKRTQPVGREAEGASGGVACSLQPLCRDAPSSLLAIRPFCLYARPAPVFQQSRSERGGKCDLSQVQKSGRNQTESNCGQLERWLRKSSRRQQNSHPSRQPDTIAVTAAAVTTHYDGRRRNVSLPWLRS